MTFFKYFSNESRVIMILFAGKKRFRKQPDEIIYKKEDL